jgi:hypothetical protein
MKEKVRFLGLDVHAETIAVAVAEPDGSVRSLGTIVNRAGSIRTLMKKLGSAEQLRACYEAGPTGYVLYWRSPAFTGTSVGAITSHKPAPTAAGPVLDQRQKQPQRPKQPHRYAEVDRVTPYQNLSHKCGTSCLISWGLKLICRRSQQ